MPRVKPLTAAQAREEAAAKADQVFRDLLAVHKARGKISDAQLSERFGWDSRKIVRIRKDPGRYTVDELRLLMHSLGASADDWLRFGGYWKG